MANKKISRKELLKQTDEFLSLSARTVIFAREHSQHFYYVGIGIVVLALIYLGINTYMNYVNKKAQNAYNTAYSAFDKAMAPDAGEESLKEPEKLFRDVMDEYGISRVSRLVPPELAYLKFQEKKYDEALTLYEKFLEDTPEDSSFRSLAWLAMAACYEQKGDLPKAIETLNKLHGARDDSFKDQALLSLARLYRLSDEKEKSTEILKEFVAKFKDSPFLPLAKAYMK